ncbi:acyltransferase family protein [Mycetocola saprophilus]|uniref:acyltransferase family protein n=1 Tax=Mycetocola saprophilus TaxID=76636 RepID=UPI0006918044|nr:acyltransferase family protein [Mycetocola saprophilus]
MSSAPTLSPTPTATAAGRFHLPGLDGLRAIAVILVIVYHAAPALAPGGFIGVDMFFVISGFLITTLLLREHAGTGRIRLGRFWLRRARRLLPALVLVVGTATALAPLIHGDLLVGLRTQVLGAATFAYNWVALATGNGYFDTTTPELLRNLWSLSVEEQFYLIWPILLLALLLIRRPWLRVGLLAAGTLAGMGWMWALTAMGANVTRIYYGTDSHSFGLLIGATLAAALVAQSRAPLDALRRMERSSWQRDLVGMIALSAIAIAVWGLRESGHATFRWGLPMVSVLAVLLVWSAISGGIWSRVLDMAPLRYIGARSYGLYLWHWPLLVLLIAAFPGQATTGAPSPLLALVAIALTVVLAILSYRFVENPIRKLGFLPYLRALHARIWRFPKPRIVMASLVTIAALAAGVGVSGLVFAPTQGSAQQLIEEGAQSLKSGYPGPIAPKPTLTPEGLADGSEMSAIGDSVMLAAAPSLQEAFPGIAVDAAVSRNMNAGLDLIQEQASAGLLRPVVVVGLGTNATISGPQLDRLAGIVGPSRHLVLVNAYAPRPWIAGVNQTLADYVAGHPRVGLCDWATAIDPQAGDLLASDRIHPGSRGGALYAATLHTTLQNLAKSDGPPEAPSYRRHEPAHP